MKVTFLKMGFEMYLGYNKPLCNRKDTGVLCGFRQLMIVSSLYSQQASISKVSFCVCKNCAFQVSEQSMLQIRKLEALQTAECYIMISLRCVGKRETAGLRGISGCP